MQPHPLPLFGHSTAICRWHIGFESRSRVILFVTVMFYAPSYFNFLFRGRRSAGSLGRQAQFHFIPLMQRFYDARVENLCRKNKMPLMLPPRSACAHSQISSLVEFVHRDMKWFMPICQYRNKSIFNLPAVRGVARLRRERNTSRSCIPEYTSCQFGHFWGRFPCR